MMLFLSLIAAGVVGYLLFQDQIQGLLGNRPVERSDRDSAGTTAPESDDELLGLATPESTRPAPETATPTPDREPIGRTGGVLDSLPEHGTDDPRLRALFDEADKAIAAGEFARAANILERARTMELGRAKYEEARSRYRFARLLTEVAARNPVQVESHAEGLYEFKIKGMGRFRGVVEFEGPNIVKIKKNNGITVPIPPDRIEDRIPITQHERTKELREELADRRIKTRTTGGGAGVGHWELACFAFASGLRDEGVDLLKKAWSIDPDLPKNIYEARARRVLREWIYYMAADIDHRQKKAYAALQKDFPDSRALAMAREMVEEEQRARKEEEAASRRAAERFPVTPDRTDKAEADAGPVADATIEALRKRGSTAETPPKPIETAPDPEPVQPKPEPKPAIERTPREPERREPEPRGRREPDSGGGGSLASQAADAYRSGMQHFQEGSTVSSAAEGRRLIQQAADDLRQAVDLYGRLVDQNPGNRDYRKKLDSAQSKLRWASRFRRV
ncbi:MAG: hypothetical protein ACOCX4_05095 [Planctomycetota bacterium]